MKNLLPLFLAFLAFFTFATAAAAETSYTVKENDCLWKIASKAKISIKTLYRINRKIIGTNPDLLKIGQKLRLPTGSASAMPALEMGYNSLTGMHVSKTHVSGTDFMASGNIFNAYPCAINEHDLKTLMHSISTAFAEEPYAIIDYPASAAMTGNKGKNLADNREQEPGKKILRKTAICSIIPISALTLYPLLGRIRRQRKNAQPKEDGQPEDTIYIGSFSYSDSTLFCSLGGTTDIFIAPLRDIARNTFKAFGAETIDRISFNLPGNMEAFQNKMNIEKSLCPLSYWQQRAFKRHVRQCSKAI